MTVDEAMSLMLRIMQSNKHLDPNVHKIGNGEYVVYLVAVEYFLWDSVDWWKYKRARL